MGESWIMAYLLLVVYLGCIVSPTVSSQFCPDLDWSYHLNTKTCIKVFTMQATFLHASKKCRNYNGGNDVAKRGHLVYIFDEITNSFVKDLIKKAGVPEALIGLHDRARHGSYSWGRNDEIRHDYYQWSDGEPRSDPFMRTVVITQDGWEKHPHRRDSSYVCQVDAVFPSPAVSCQAPAEIGQKSSPVTCALSGQDLGEFSNVTIALSGKVLATCRGNRVCEETDGYQATFDARDHTATLTIDKVGREHEGRYTCTYQFEDVPEKMSDSCQLSVYAAPSKPECSNTFTDTGVNVVCVTDKVYPEGGCSWDYRKGLFYQVLPATTSVLSKIARYILQNGEEYFQTTCTTDVTISEAGTYTFKVTMFPDGFQHISNANISNEVKVRISPPEHCDEETPRFGVATNKNVAIKLCVFGYPPPTNFKLYPASLALNPDTEPLDRQRYDANFQYTNEETAQGVITIIIQNLQPQDLGNFIIYSSVIKDVYSFLQFTLILQGPPSCPSEVQTIKTYSDTVTLSWKPGFNGGPPQTFIVKSEEHDTKQEVKDTEEDIVIYNVTGLTENSPYIFSIDVFNDEGLTECPDVHVNVPLKVSLPVPEEETQSATTIILVLIIIILIAIIIGLTIFVVKRGRKHKQEKSKLNLGARFTAVEKDDDHRQYEPVNVDIRTENVNTLTRPADTELSQPTGEDPYVNEVTQQPTDDHTYSRPSNEGDDTGDKHVYIDLNDDKQKQEGTISA